MLKIKDSVDLKELEKFEFTKHTQEDAEIDYYKPVNIGMLVILKNRNIDIEFPINSIHRGSTFDCTCYIADLIKADLVEKVEE